MGKSVARNATENMRQRAFRGRAAMMASTTTTTTICGFYTKRARQSVFRKRREDSSSKHYSALKRKTGHQQHKAPVTMAILDCWRCDSSNISYLIYRRAK